LMALKSQDHVPARARSSSSGRRAWTARLQGIE